MLAVTDAIAAIRARLVRHRGNYRAIAARHGLGYSWLGKFARGDRGTRPSFELVSKLTNALDELDLEQSIAAPPSEGPDG